jgi:Domain of unknown function (DUF1793)
MVFQNILDMFIFPSSVMEMEIAYYLENLHPYGVPLDVRRYYLVFLKVHFNLSKKK